MCSELDTYRAARDMKAAVKVTLKESTIFWSEIFSGLSLDSVASKLSSLDYWTTVYIAVAEFYKG